MAFFILPQLAHANLYTTRSRPYPVGPNPCSVAVADLNDNGLPDIVTADRGELTDLREQRPANDEVSILFAQADGSYVRHQPSLKSGFGPYHIAIANIDALKWPDIIVANFHAVRHRDISLYLNRKDEGLFNAYSFRVNDDNLRYYRHRDGDDIPYFATPGLSSLRIYDVNRDGLRDIVAAGWSSDVLVFMPGHAEHFFDESATKFSHAPGGPADLQLVHLDGDGLIDAVAVMSATNEVALFKGDGTGAFVEQTRFLSRGHTPNRVHCGDINGDGRVDIAVSHPYAEDSIVIFYGEGNYKFSMSQEIQLGTDLQVLEHEIRDFVLDDLNGNGRLDLAAACHASGNVIVLLNESAPGAPMQRFTRETYSFDDVKPRALATATMQDKSVKHLVVALWGTNTVVVLGTR